MAKSRGTISNYYFFVCGQIFFYYSSLFHVLYQAILAAVVIANLIGLLRQFSRLKDLWKIHKPDAVRYSSVTSYTNVSQQMAWFLFLLCTFK